MIMYQVLHFEDINSGIFVRDRQAAQLKSKVTNIRNFLFPLVMVTMILCTYDDGFLSVL